MMRDGLHTIDDLAPRIASGDLSPVTLVRECLDRIDAGRDLNAFICVLADQALADAAQAEREIADGKYRGPLHGIPVSLKDLVDLTGTPTTSGSAVPPPLPSADAPLARRLKQAGAIIIGKTNLHEFAFGTTGDESAFGAVKNPHDVTRSAGGSSSGAAVALVRGMCVASIGTDTGGSIRIPAAACGTVGLKPSYGEVSTEGVVPLSTTCDHAGPLTLSVADARTVFEALTGRDCATKAATQPIVLGVPSGYLLERLDRDVRAMLSTVRARLASAGLEVKDVDIGDVSLTPDVYLHIVLPEAAEYHARYLETHADKYCPGVRLRLEMGRTVMAEDYIRALRLREMLRERVDRALGGVTALLLPALSIPSPPLGAATVDIDGTPEPVRSAMLRLTQLFNLTGHPALALPAGRNGDGLPLSIQLVGARNETPRLLQVAELVEAQITGGAGSVGGGTGG